MIPQPPRSTLLPYATLFRASQVSLTVGAGKTGAFGHWIGETATGQVIVGGVVSMTTTVWLQMGGALFSTVVAQGRLKPSTASQLLIANTSLEVTFRRGSYM